MTGLFDKCRRDGFPLSSYTCPHCNHALETRIPKQEDVTSKGYWDSCKSCYECGKLSFVLMYPNGDVILIDFNN